jgi:hypothetical protein
MMPILLRVCLAAAAVAVLMAAPASAQTTPAQTARLLLTVVDPTGGVIPGATVTIAGLEASTKAATIAPVKSTEAGLATLDKLAPGRYLIRAEFPGFQPAELKDQRLRAGENKHIPVLPIKRVEDSVVVGRDARDVATDRTLTFGSVLTREQIQALSDDPDEMRRQLMEMAGSDAVIKVDSFEGQQLPPKAQIKSIRMSRDQFAAENHASFSSIDIVTQPGIGPLRTSMRGNFYDSGLDGKNPLVQARGPGQNRGFGGSLGGTLLREKADFSLSVNGSNNWSTPQVYAATTSGTQAGNLNIRQPTRNTGVSGLLNYALTKDQTIRFGMNVNESEQRNQGVGQLDVSLDRAFSTENRSWGLRFQETGPLGRRFVTNTRFTVSTNRSATKSVVEAPTIVVPDNFTVGGAQRSGGSTNRSFAFQQDLDYVRGLHSVRAGIMVDGGHVKSGLSTNYLGTYTFEDFDAYLAGRPRSYSRRLGDPTIEYWNVQTGLYIQDDIRPRKNISISLGLRYEMQMRVDDKANFAPRAGFTWSPLQSGRISVRGSWGIFYDWYQMGLYGQVLQTDGTRQREVNLLNPSYPDPGPLDVASAPSNRYLLEDKLRMPWTNRSSLGLSGSIGRLYLGGTYSYNRQSNVLVGENLNAPVNGVRPDPALANIFRAVGRARSMFHSVSGNASLNLGPMGATAPASASQPFFSPRRGLYVSTFFGISRSRSQSQGAFSVPFSANLEDEWAPSGSPWNMHASLSSGMFKNLNVNLGVNASAGGYYTIRTGRDDNGDLIFNDRPAGVGRNTERGAMYLSSSLYLNYNLGFGRQTTSMPGGIMIMERGGVLTAGPGSAMAAPRYRLNFGVSIDNPTNRANYGGYSGVMTSEFFRKPTSVSGVRRVMFNAGLSF